MSINPFSSSNSNFSSSSSSSSKRSDHPEEASSSNKRQHTDSLTLEETFERDFQQGLELWNRKDNPTLSRQLIRNTAEQYYLPALEALSKAYNPLTRHVYPELTPLELSTKTKNLTYFFRTMKELEKTAHLGVTIGYQGTTDFLQTMISRTQPKSLVVTVIDESLPQVLEILPTNTQCKSLSLDFKWYTKIQTLIHLCKKFETMTSLNKLFLTPFKPTLYPSDHRTVSAIHNTPVDTSSLEIHDKTRDNTHIDPEQINALGDSLGHLISQLPHLTTLSINGFGLTPSALILFSQHLQNATSLTSLDLGRNSVVNEAMSAVTKALSTHPSITTLFLEDVSFESEEDVSHLSQLVRQSTTLTCLSLNDFEYSFSFIKLWEALASNPSLNELSITSSTSIQMEQAEVDALAYMLTKNTLLTSLNLDTEEQAIGSHIGLNNSPDNFINALRINSTLTSLSLQNAFDEQVLFESDFFPMLYANTSLTELNISKCSTIGEDLDKCVRTLLQKNHTLRSFDCTPFYMDSDSEDDDNDQFLESLGPVLEQNPSLTELKTTHYDSSRTHEEDPIRLSLKRNQINSIKKTKTLFDMLLPLL